MNRFLFMFFGGVTKMPWKKKREKQRKRDDLQRVAEKSREEYKFTGVCFRRKKNRGS
ncbi:hypothetical protein HanIR_Chr16g0836591 [Helianthus annuus]|nr:hypothetical protein HanIR_Chr16g0836591 [Helianthus annuus]